MRRLILGTEPLAGSKVWKLESAQLEPLSLKPPGRLRSLHTAASVRPWKNPQYRDAQCSVEDWV